MSQNGMTILAFHAGWLALVPHVDVQPIQIAVVMSKRPLSPEIRLPHGRVEGLDPCRF